MTEPAKPFRMTVRKVLLVVFTVGMLLGALALTLKFNNDHRQEVARLGQEVMTDFIDGNSGFTIIRDFHAQHLESKSVTGVLLLDPDGQIRNRYPRAFEPQGQRFNAPIVGPDGVMRGEVSAFYAAVLPPFDLQLLLWMLMGGFAAAVVAAFYETSRFDRAQLRIVALEKEAEIAKLTEERLRKDAELAKLTEEQLRKDAELARISFVWNDMYGLLAEEAGRLSNHLQEMDGFIAQLKINLNDAVHDLYKAPLVGTGPLNVTGSEAPVTDVKAFLKRLEDRSVLVTQEQVTDFVRSVDQTMDSIKWVIDGLPEFANLQSEEFDPSHQVQILMRNLPPNLLTKKWLTVAAITDVDILPISFNRVHFRSVVKNALYNASAALQQRRLKDPNRGARLDGWIGLRFIEREDAIGVVIEDNGPGLSDAALARLYRTKVDESPDNKNGKGSVIVAAYLSFHGATVDVANRAEGGARITFWFQKAPLDAVLVGHPDPIPLEQVGA